MKRVYKLVLEATTEVHVQAESEAEALRRARENVFDNLGADDFQVVYGPEPVPLD